MHTVMAAGVSGRSVLITGVGIIGLMAVTIARAAGAATILVTDRDPKRLDLAKQLGADVAFHSSDETWVAEARKLTHDQGPEVLLEMSGHPVAIRQGFAPCATAAQRLCWELPASLWRSICQTTSSSKGPPSWASTADGCSKPGIRSKTLSCRADLNLAPIVTHRRPGIGW
jgi:threonine 3-dehydrogenase